MGIKFEKQTDIGVSANYWNIKPRKVGGHIKASKYTHPLDNSLMNHINTRLYGRVSEEAYRNNDAKPIDKINIGVDAPTETPITDSLVYGLILLQNNMIEQGAVGDEVVEYSDVELNALRKFRKLELHKLKQQEGINVKRLIADETEISAKITEIENKYQALCSDVENANTITELQNVVYVFDYENPKG